MKRYLIIVALGLSGCLTGSQPPDLSKVVVGRWRMTAFDGYGTPMTNAVAIVEFRKNDTWISRIRTASETNVYHGTFSVSGNQLTLASPQGGESEDWDKYTYSNNILESIALNRKSMARKIKTATSDGFPESSIYPEIDVIHFPETLNLFSISNTTDRTVYLEVNANDTPAYQINYKATDGLNFGFGPADSVKCKELAPHDVMVFPVILMKTAKPYSAWQVDTIAYSSPHSIAKTTREVIRDLGPCCRATSPWVSSAQEMAQQSPGE